MVFISTLQKLSHEEDLYLEEDSYLEEEPNNFFAVANCKSGIIIPSAVFCF